MDIIIRGTYAITVAENDGWKVVKYKYVDRPEGETSSEFTIAGDNTPEMPGMIYTFTGRWVTRGNYRNFDVYSYKSALPDTKEGVVAFCPALHCKVGKKTAAKLFDMFGTQLWDVLENQPEQLRKAGMKQALIDNFRLSVKNSQVFTRVMQLFQGVDVAPSKVRKLIKLFGSDTEYKVKHHPYAVASLDGFSFQMMDALALRWGVDPANIERRVASAVAVLDTHALKGDVCLIRGKLIGEMTQVCNKPLREPIVTQEMCNAAITQGVSDRILVSTSGYIYTAARGNQERRLTAELMRLMQAPCERFDDASIDAIIERYQAEENITLADSQKEAVKCCVNNPVAVLTGGPGTGKTTTEKAILFAFKALYGETAQPLLLAPTGKAARRMAESTGYPASTIHSALQLYGDMPTDDEEGAEPLAASDYLDADFVMVDEASMADQYVATELVHRIPTGTKLLFVGDPDQLPSVGDGDVLRELIRSQAVPTTQLSVIFRQAQGNPIIANAAKTLAGDANLVESNTFVVMDIPDSNKVFVRAVSMYVQAVRKYGMDSTILLCPMRKAGTLNVNALNYAIQQVLNPEREDELCVKGKSVFINPSKSVPLKFRKGDRVMMTTNCAEAKNGDTGVIHDIVKTIDPDDARHTVVKARVEFNNDGNVHEFDSDKIRDLDLAYACTVHKSQGSEYQNVIMVVVNEHRKMLRRNLFYTGITRSSKNVLLIGQRSAIANAIHDVDTEKRCTLLADRLHAAMMRIASSIA